MTIKYSMYIACALLTTGSLFSQRTEDPIFNVVKENNNRRVVELIAEDESIVKVRDEDGNTPLLIAKSEEIAETLLAAGSDPNAHNNYGVTALDLASRKGYAKLTALLIKAGAQVTASDNERQTPLHVAAAWGRETIVETLLQAGADVVARDHNGLTPLHKAAYMGRDKVSEILLQNGAFVNARDNNNRSALDFAKRYGQTKVVVILQNALNKNEL